MVGQVPRTSLKTAVFNGPAFYGKIPAHGDFLSRNLKADFVAQLDAWLTQWLLKAKEEWGSEFEDIYCIAQPWLFSGTRNMAILIPSFDRVQRYFPLFVVTDAGVHMQALYDTIVSSIAEGLTADALLENIMHLKPGGDNDSNENWFLPDEKELAMPHPLSGQKTEWIRAALT